MTTRTIRHPHYHEDHQALAAASPGPAWLDELRAAGWERFNEIGFPTARRGNERWKYTAVAPIARVEFAYPPQFSSESSAAVSVIALLREMENSTSQSALSLVFVDGQFQSWLSSPISVESFIAAPLSVVGNDHGKGDLGQHILADDGFAALNTAFINDIAYIWLPDGLANPVSVQLTYVNSGGGVTAVHPRTLILAGRNTNLTVVETYTGPAGPRYFTNAVTEIALSEGAQVDHYRLLNESPGAYHVGSTRVSQARDSSFSSASFALGTALARNDFAVTLDGPGAYCSLNGLYYTGQGQHIDNLISIDHAQPHCTSRLNYKGILDGNSRAVFGGEVVVRRNAQKSDAQQTDKNLLLSEDAEVDSKPSLMIYADDVQCSHGATAGQIDSQTLFYLRSRGLDLEAASRMLVQAFAREIVDTVKPETLRNYLESLFDRNIAVKSLPVGRM